MMWQQVLLAGWALLIFATSSLPPEFFPSVSVDWLPKAVHAVYFFVFCFLMYRIIRAQPNFPALRRFAIPLSLFLSLLYGISDETHQFFVDGRTARLSDVAIDASSAALFAIALWVTTAVRSWRSETTAP
jgi:VanZ family protein